MTLGWRAGFFRKPDVSLIHEFQRPPYGGGNQFLLGLRKEFRRRGIVVETNHIAASSHACLFNSFNFDFDALRRWKRPGCRMVHRVDGPIAAYRGRDDGTDRRIADLNDEIADTTVFQSHYSLRAHVAAGLEFKAPVVIMNAVDSDLFHPRATPAIRTGRKIRLISTSWSDNLNKGGASYKWIEGHLDWDRFEYTFAGRSAATFDRVRVIPPLPSRELGALLRDHDVYVTASAHDPCSNALLEALACGLPAVFLRSGGHPEIVGGAGRGFDEPEEALDAIHEVARDIESFRSRISIPTLRDVASQYLAAMGIAQENTVQ
ncbi:MAG: glycosyltransferase family 4 protein [Chloroflexota bacterium]